MAKYHHCKLKGAWKALPNHERQHSYRVARLAVSFGMCLGLSRRDLQHLWRGALLHDIGKALIPESILLKPGPLSDDERCALRLHPRMGHDMLAPIVCLHPALAVPLFHHERWDGLGYPYGLQGEATPFMARLFAVVDVWDALRTERPYSPPWPECRTRDHLKAGAGSQFDPTMVEAFLDWLPQSHAWLAMRSISTPVLS